ncbi:hypothetical protein AB6D53_12835 [Vibrio splendidus]
MNFTPKNNIYNTFAANLCGVKSINNIVGLGMMFINENHAVKLARFLNKISHPKAYTIAFSSEDDRAPFAKHKLSPLDITDRVPGSGVGLSRFSVSSSKDDRVVCFLLIARML